MKLRLPAIFLIGVISCYGDQRSTITNDRQHPESFAANHAAGENLLSQKQIARAIPFLERAHRLQSDNYANSYDLALAYFSNGQLEKSRELITVLLRTRQVGELHNLLGDVAEAQGRFNEAAREYETAARIEPSQKYLFDLGSDLAKHRDFAPALKVFVFGTERYPQSPELRVGLGITYYSLGRYDDAVESLCHAVDLAPTDTRALEFLGKMVGVSDQYTAQVTRHLAHFAESYPYSAPANYYYGVSLLDRAGKGSDAERRRKARPYLERAIALAPEFGEAHYTFAALLEDDADDRAAIREYKRAILYQTHLGNPHYRLARLYRKTGQVELARREFAEVAGSKTAANPAQ